MVPDAILIKKSNVQIGGIFESAGAAWQTKAEHRAHRHLSEVSKAICLWPIKLSDYKNKFCHFLCDTFVSNTHAVLL